MIRSLRFREHLSYGWTDSRRKRSPVRLTLITYWIFLEVISGRSKAKGVWSGSN